MRISVIHRQKHIVNRSEINVQLVIGTKYRVTFKEDEGIQIVLPSAVFAGRGSSASKKALYHFVQGEAVYAVSSAGIESFEEVN